MIPRSLTMHEIARQSPLVQECYSALAALKRLCDDANGGDYYLSGHVDAEEVWSSLDPLRRLLAEVDGTAFSARIDSLSDADLKEIFAGVRGF